MYFLLPSNFHPFSLPLIFLAFSTPSISLIFCVSYYYSFKNLNLPSLFGLHFSSLSSLASLLPSLPYFFLFFPFLSFSALSLLNPCIHSFIVSILHTFSSFFLYPPLSSPFSFLSPLTPPHLLPHPPFSTLSGPENKLWASVTRLIRGAWGRGTEGGKEGGEGAFFPSLATCYC